jgi:hypothetical protein
MGSKQAYIEPHSTHHNSQFNCGEMGAKQAYTEPRSTHHNSQFKCYKAQICVCTAGGGQWGSLNGQKQNGRKRKKEYKQKTN